MDDTKTSQYSLDSDLDDIADLPGFSVFHSGAVLVDVISFEEKKVNEHDAATFKVKLIGDLGWTEPENALSDPYPKPNDTMDIAFMTDNAVGMGFLKQFVAPCAAKFGIKKMRASCEAMVSKQIIIVGMREPATVGKGAEKKIVPGKFYYRVKNVAFPD